MKLKTYNKQAQLLIKCFNRFNLNEFRYHDVIQFVSHRSEAIAISNAVQLGYIIRTNRGRYQFTKAINASMHEKVALEIREFQRKRMKDYNEKRSLPKEDPSQLSITDDDFTLRAITHLKSLGYRILKPINEWKEL